ncbi:MAG: hypothetical protein O9318_04540 [Hylemonella sp.]|uniref:hypothetical protein n=1 Tax=Hylemonella sp. TaxID=2066020 RepID=UPI0022BD112C|nr:hypothetical protein [Hylemonella sp.]MCZ8251719.1 hypothetical protein [Hylemonella sp.]
MKSKGDDESFLFKNRLDSSIFLLILGAALCFVVTLCLGFLAQVAGFRVHSDDLRALLFFELLLLLASIAYALFLRKVVAWANAVLKIKWGPQDAAPALIYLVARSIGAICRTLIKFVSSIISR